ncbi:hypothetical protein I552_1614 [Mycobacterium xenopi 3993]|nr:hypothetical protein I552_1614 [Mycobacterium xenopi 3993]
MASGTGRSRTWRRLGGAVPPRTRRSPWREVLQDWWPRLLPGCMGSLTHGLIRTAHAVRSVREAARPSKLQIDELARALGFWATSFQPLQNEPGGDGDLDDAAVDRALSELTAEYAGHYTATMPSFPVPLIHTITAPAAMRLLLADVPAELHAASLRTITEVNREVFSAFGGQRLAASLSSWTPTTRSLTSRARRSNSATSMRSSSARPPCAKMPCAKTLAISAPPAPPSI